MHNRLHPNKPLLLYITKNPSKRGKVTKLSSPCGLDLAPFLQWLPEGHRANSLTSLLILVQLYSDTSTGSPIMQVSAKKKKGTIVVTLSEKPLFSFLEYEIVSYPHSMVVYGLFDV